MDSPKPNLEDLRIRRDARPKAPSRSWLWLVVLLLLVALIGLGAWWRGRTTAMVVRTLTIQTGRSAPADHTVLNASGYVTARRSATVSSKITGKVTEVLIEEGMKVKEGQILARLDDTNTRASLELADAQLKSARAALEETRVRIIEADLNLRRTQDLATNSISAQADLEHAQADDASLKAHLEQQKADMIVAEKQLATWQQQMEDTIIRAPFDGVVTSKNAQPGEMISPISAGGGFTRTGIGTIVDMQSLEIEIDVNESYIHRVEPGQAVEAALDAYPDWKIPCKVVAIIPTADRDKSTVKVRVGFDRLDPRILPQMGVKVAFHEATSPTGVANPEFSLPRNAVRQEEGRSVVWIVHSGRVERRAVVVRDTIGDNSTIIAGLTEGERVAVDPPAGLTDGATVTETTP